MFYWRRTRCAWPGKTCINDLITLKLVPSGNRSRWALRRLVAMLPVSFHTPVVSAMASGRGAVDTPIAKRAATISDEVLIRFIQMISFRGFF
jgi:hypothetical protein